jgi:hypothetical protein
MSIRKNAVILGTGLAVLTAANVFAARTYQLKKVMIISETGSGGYAHTNQINFTEKYFSQTLAPKYGFTAVIPATQAAIDAEMKDDVLKTYDVVIFNGGTRIGGTNAVGDTAAQHAFQRWFKAGGGCLSIHGLLDHNNTWPWLRDSVLNGSIFTQHSVWGQDPNAKVQWDTLKTSGELRSMKPEYDSIRACYPKGKFIYPDEWYSISPNVRPYADVLMTIDESSYTVPNGAAMGLGHPVMWAYHMPPDKDGNQGRFIYTARGHETGAWDGTSSNHAPMTVAQGAIQEGNTVFSDTSHTLMTKGWLLQALKWAAGLRVPDPTSTTFQATNATLGGIMDSQSKNGILSVQVKSAGNYEVNVFTVAGKSVARRTGNGNAEYSFTGLKGSTLYVVQVKTGKKISSQRVLL